MVWTPRVTVAAVIEQNDCFLMVQESIDNKLVLNQPAGHLEPGESLLQAVIREVLEETARNFTPTGLVGIYRWEKPGSQLTYLRFCFCGTVTERLAGRALDKDILDTTWASLEDLAAQPERLRSPLVLGAIHDHLRRAPFALDILHDLG